MRIDLTSRAPEPAESGKPGRRTISTPSAASDRGELASDEAKLSLDSMRVQTLEAQVNRLPELRQEKVEALQRAIQQGSYKVGAEQIAGAMFAELVARSGLVR